MAAIQYSSGSTDGWEDQAVVEDPLKDSLLLIKTLRLLLRQLSVNPGGQETTSDPTSSTGPKYMR